MSDQKKIISESDRAAFRKESYLRLLEGIPLFSEFTEVAVNKLLKNTLHKKFHKNQTMLMIGDEADYFYVIINGWVKLYRETLDGHETIVAMLSNDEIFGRCAVLENGSYPYSAQAVSEVNALLIPSRFMLYMAQNHREFDHFLAKFLETERNEFNQKGLETEHLTHMPSAERVGCCLLRMCGEVSEGRISLKFPYEKSLVAGRLGMTPETFSRSLNQLSALGVETIESEVIVHNTAQLRSYVCEHCSATRQECPHGELIKQEQL